MNAKRKAILIPSLRKAYIPINKNASSSCSTALHDHFGHGDYKGINYTDVPEYADRAVAVLRPPIERAISAYNFLRVSRGYSKESTKRDRMPESPKFPSLELPFDKFIKACLKHDKKTLDPHIAPQHFHLWMNVPMTLIPWDFGRFAEEFDMDPTIIGHANKGRDRTQPDIDGKILNDLYRLFYVDFLLYDLANK